MMKLCQSMKTPFLLLATLLLAPLVSLQAADVVNLRCEYLKDPLGIDVAKPRLSWVIDAPQSEISNLKSQITRSVRQTAYQVLVASTPELLAKDKGDLWDSGKVESDQSIQVEYAGKPPESRMKSHWKVRLWTLTAASPTAWSAPASWTMGLLKPEDWQAKWITYPDPKRLSHPWLRRTFEMKEDVERAVIYINTASYYELHINGKKVGPYVLEPGITQNSFTVSIDSSLFKGRTFSKATMLPYGSARKNLNMETRNGKMAIQIPELDIWALVVLE
jgi:alpha-L-rhamnosidase